jgi:hypothetical protein
VVRDILLGPLLLCELILADLIVASHRTKQTAPKGSYRSTSSRVSPNQSAANGANARATCRPCQGPSPRRLLRRRWSDSPRSRGRIKSGLLGRPAPAFPLVPILLFRALTTRGIYEHVNRKRHGRCGGDEPKQRAQCRCDFFCHADSPSRRRPHALCAIARVWDPLAYPTSVPQVSPSQLVHFCNPCLRAGTCVHGKMLVFLRFHQRVNHIESTGSPKPFNLTQRVVVIGVASNALKPFNRRRVNPVVEFRDPPGRPCCATLRAAC